MLEASLGDLAFSFPNRARDKLARGFSTNHYEAVTLGIQTRLNELYPENKEQMIRLGQSLEEAKKAQAFYDVTMGGGKNSPGPLRARIKFIEDAVAKL